MKHDMSGEKQPVRKRLLPEGWREFEIISCEPSVSKAGKEMFVFQFQDLETAYVDNIYAISIQGKRWFLKSILTACGIPAGQDGIYDWEIKDVIGKKIQGLIEHEDNTWINREGEEVTTKQHRIVEVKSPDESEEIGWDDDK